MKRGASGISCLLAIDKPAGLSSHDVVNRVRSALGERRVGHAGTLDPAATGVLVVGVGQATRLLGLLTLDDKRYDARIEFGSETTTDDAEGEVCATAEVPARLGEGAVAHAVVASLVGPCDQLPPAYSAISIDGRRAYDRARAGEEVELPVRHVTIHDARLVRVNAGEPLTWNVALHVSKGTYVRSIARDLGRSMGTAAHLAALRRTASGPITLGDCVSLDELAELGPQCVLESALDPVRALGLPRLDLTERELEDVRAGRRIFCREAFVPGEGNRTLSEDECVALVFGTSLVGVWQRQANRLSCVANFPDGVSGVVPL